MPNTLMFISFTGAENGFEYQQQGQSLPVYMRYDLLVNPVALGCGGLECYCIVLNGYIQLFCSKK